MKLLTSYTVSCVTQHTNVQARRRRRLRAIRAHRTKERSTVMSSTNKEAVTKTVEVEGTAFAYREVGPTTGVPVVFLHHFTAVLDDWDPRRGRRHRRRTARHPGRPLGRRRLRRHHPRQHRGYGRGRDRVS